MGEVLTLLSTYLPIASQVVAAAAIIAAITPSPKDDSVLRKVRAVVDILAFNVGHAKNALKF